VEKRELLVVETWKVRTWLPSFGPALTLVPGGVEAPLSSLTVTVTAGGEAGFVLTPVTVSETVAGFELTRPSLAWQVKLVGSEEVGGRGVGDTRGTGLGHGAGAGGAGDGTETAVGGSLDNGEGLRLTVGVRGTEGDGDGGIFRRVADLASATGACYAWGG